MVGKLSAIRKRPNAGAPAKDGGMAHNHYAASWIASTLDVSDRKATTKSLYATLTRTHIIGSPLGALGLKKITPAAVERFILALRKSGKSEPTVRQIYTVGRAIFDAAVRDGLLARNPFTAVKRPKVTATEAASLSPAQASALLAAAERSRYAAASSTATPDTSSAHSPSTPNRDYQPRGVKPGPPKRPQTWNHVPRQV